MNNLLFDTLEPWFTYLTHWIKASAHPQQAHWAPSLEVFCCDSSACLLLPLLVVCDPQRRATHALDLFVPSLLGVNYISAYKSITHTGNVSVKEKKPLLGLRKEDRKESVPPNSEPHNWKRSRPNRRLRVQIGGNVLTFSLYMKELWTWKSKLLTAGRMQERQGWVSVWRAL